MMYGDYDVATKDMPLDVSFLYEIGERFKPVSTEVVQTEYPRTMGFHTYIKGYDHYLASILACLADIKANKNVAENAARLAVVRFLATEDVNFTEQAIGCSWLIKVTATLLEGGGDISTVLQQAPGINILDLDAEEEDDVI